MANNNPNGYTATLPTAGTMVYDVEERKMALVRYVTPSSEPCFVLEFVDGSIARRLVSSLRWSES